MQCEGEVGDSWRLCNRTLFAQTGLGFMVLLFLAIKVVGALAPKRILEKHMVQAKNVITMKMNLEGYVQCGCLLIASSSIMFMLSSYGAEGDFDNVEEKITFISLGSVGLCCLLLTAFWKLVVIRIQMKREAEFGPESGREESADTPLTEASSFWVVVGVLATSLNSAVNVAGAVTLDDFYESLSRFMLPLVILFYWVALSCQPRRNSPKDMWRLRFHFMSFAWISEAGIIVFYIRGEDSINAMIHVVFVAAYSLLFHWGLKLRATVGRLPEKGETCEPSK